MNTRTQDSTDRQTRRKTDQRYQSIDFCKGVCILFVITTHYAWTDTERLRLLFPFWIDMAVPLFMIISGYVYTKSFFKNSVSNIYEAYTVHFLLGKVVRYTTPFLIAFFIEEILFRIFGNNHSLLQMCNLFLQGGTGPGSYYYPIMIQFLFFFPVIFFIIRRYRYTGLFMCGAINVIYEVLKSAYCMNEECYRLLLFRYTLLIAFGSYLASDSDVKHQKYFFFCLFVGILYIIICKYIGFVPLVTYYWTGTSMWACLYIIPIAKYFLISNIRNQCLEVVGKASYDIFLVQMVYYNFVNFVYQLIPNRILQLIINMAVCVIAGICFYYVETPITKKVSKKLYCLWNTKINGILRGYSHRKC